MEISESDDFFIDDEDASLFSPWETWSQASSPSPSTFAESFTSVRQPLPICCNRSFEPSSVKSIDTENAYFSQSSDDSDSISEEENSTDSFINYEDATHDKCSEIGVLFLRHRHNHEMIHHRQKGSPQVIIELCYLRQKCGCQAKIIVEQKCLHQKTIEAWEIHCS